MDPGNQQAQRNLANLKQQRQELQKERAEALKYTRNKHQEEIQQEKEQQRKERREKALKAVSNYNQNRLDAFSRQRGLNKSLMDAQMEGVEGEYRRSKRLPQIEAVSNLECSKALRVVVWTFSVPTSAIARRMKVLLPVPPVPNNSM